MKRADPPTWGKATVTSGMSHGVRRSPRTRTVYGWTSRRSRSPAAPAQDERKLPVSLVNGPRLGTTWINSRTPLSSNSGARSPGSGGEAVPVPSTSRRTGRPGARVAHLVLTWEFRAQEPRVSRRETAAPRGSSAPRGARAGAGRCVWLAAA